MGGSIWSKLGKITCKLYSEYPAVFFRRAVQDSLLLGIMYWAFHSLQCLYPKPPERCWNCPTMLASFRRSFCFCPLKCKLSSILFIRHVIDLYVLTKVRSRFTEDFYLHQIKDQRDQIKHLEYGFKYAMNWKLTDFMLKELVKEIFANHP